MNTLYARIALLEELKMKLAYGIAHKSIGGIEVDRNGRYELYTYKPNFSNKKDYKIIEVKLIVRKK